MQNPPPILCNGDRVKIVLLCIFLFIIFHPWSTQLIQEHLMNSGICKSNKNIILVKIELFSKAWFLFIYEKGEIKWTEGMYLQADFEIWILSDSQGYLYNLWMIKNEWDIHVFNFENWVFSEKKLADFLLYKNNGGQN